MKKLIVLALVVGMMFTGSLALAGSRGWGHGMSPGYCWSNAGASNLNLTEEQSGKLQTLREDYVKEITPLQNQMISLRAEMRLLWNAAGPEAEKILAKQRELSGIQAQLDEKAAQYRLDCRAMLTPEQQSKMTSFGPGMGRGMDRCGDMAGDGDSLHPGNVMEMWNSRGIAPGMVS
ncbi:MAG: Spy/CpxP family protein refolding chaperone [Deltaproteobacteria bacterium]|nr:Spy/CpxP family protein refolding chaperone [Deltaproteobacteria bacterium]